MRSRFNPIPLVPFVFVLTACQEPQRGSAVQPGAPRPAPEQQPPSPAQPQQPMAEQPSTAQTQPEAPGGNHPPLVIDAKFVAGPSGLRVVANTADQDNDPVTLRYSWHIGDREVSRSDTAPALKKGDNVSVTLTPNDGKTDGNAETITMIIKNGPPEIEKNEKMQIDSSGKLVYQIRASDPEGDRLTYKLASGPQGMAIDPQSGLVTWDTQDAANGEYKATVLVTDTAGGSASYTFAVRLNREK